MVFLKAMRCAVVEFARRALDGHDELRSTFHRGAGVWRFRFRFGEAGR